MSAEDIEVFVCLAGIDHRGGTLWCDRETDSMRFAYAPEWLENSLRFELDPALPLVEGGAAWRRFLLPNAFASAGISAHSPTPPRTAGGGGSWNLPPSRRTSAAP